MNQDPTIRSILRAVAAAAAVLMLASMLFASTAGATNPCGNHGNNCQCETVDTDEPVSTEVVCASVAEAYASSIAKAVAEASSQANASCSSAQISCSQAVSLAADAVQSCGDTTLTCEGGSDYVGGKLCADRRFKYDSDGRIRRTVCKRFAIPVQE